MPLWNIYEFGVKPSPTLVYNGAPICLDSQLWLRFDKVNRFPVQATQWDYPKENLHNTSSITIAITRTTSLSIRLSLKLLGNDLPRIPRGELSQLFVFIKIKVYRQLKIWFYFWSPVLVRFSTWNLFFLKSMCCHSPQSWEGSQRTRIFIVESCL